MWPLVAGLTGAIGLFLLGMTMLTDGLRLAAGPAPERILGAATRTRWHALGSALAGFGLLFLGLAMLQQAFTALAAR